MKESVTGDPLKPLLPLLDSICEVVPGWVHLIVCLDQCLALEVVLHNV